MTKTCISIITDDFKKCLLNLPPENAAKVVERIAYLELMENDRSQMPDRAQSPESVVGDRLTVLNKNTFAIKTKNFDRALAIVKKEDGKKIFLWYWTGSHEDYNKKLKPHLLAQSERTESAKHEGVIAEQLKELAKTNVIDNIKSIRDKAAQNSKNHHNKKKR